MPVSIADQRLVDPLPDYDPGLGRWLWALEECRQRTLLVLKDVTDDSIGWVPPEGGNSIAALLYHIAAIELDWLHTDILEGAPFPREMDTLFPVPVRDAAGQLSLASDAMLEAALLRLAQVRGHFMASLEGMTVAEFRRVRQVGDYQVTPEWVVHHLLQHEAEHRGQIDEIWRRARLSAA